MVRLSTCRRIRLSTEGSITSLARAALISRRQYRSTLAGSVRTTVRRLELAVPGASNTLICRAAWCPQDTSAISWANERSEASGSSGSGLASRTARTRSAWYSSTSSTAIASLDSKWWYRLPGRMPEAAATSRIDVLAYPSEANRPAAARRISSRRRILAATGVLGTEDGDTVTRPLCGRRGNRAAFGRTRGGRRGGGGFLRWSPLAGPAGAR